MSGVGSASRGSESGVKRGITAMGCSLLVWELWELFNYPVPSRSSGEHQVSTTDRNTAAGPASNSPQKKEKKRKKKKKKEKKRKKRFFFFAVVDYRVWFLIFGSSFLLRSFSWWSRAAQGAGLLINRSKVKSFTVEY